MDMHVGECACVRVCVCVHMCVCMCVRDIKKITGKEWTKCIRQSEIKRVSERQTDKQRNRDRERKREREI